MLWRRKGRLVYIMGPSGVGKDTLLRHLRPHCHPGRVIFARRHITRPLSENVDSLDEKYIPLSEEEFVRKRDTGFFALYWHSHGLYYGVSAAIDEDLQRGRMVVVNGSRGHLGEALRRYPEMLPVLIEARPDVLRERLCGRGREQGEALEERLRGMDLPVPAPCVRIDNSGPLEQALGSLLSLLRGYGA